MEICCPNVKRGAELWVQQGDSEKRLPREGEKDIRFVLAVNKADLLPNQVTPARLEVMNALADCHFTPSEV
jgi:hypothetical protein